MTGTSCPSKLVTKVPNTITLSDWSPPNTVRSTRDKPENVPISHNKHTQQLCTGRLPKTTATVI
eukprot:scaffold207258_cov64-Attheya_sp.AAC.1